MRGKNGRLVVNLIFYTAKLVLNLVSGPHAPEGKPNFFQKSETFPAENTNSTESCRTKGKANHGTICSPLFKTVSFSQQTWYDVQTTPARACLGVWKIIVQKT